MKIGFFGLLGLILITLKLTGTIAIGWGWIVAIVCAPLLIILAFLVLAVVVAAMGGETKVKLR